MKNPLPFEYIIGLVFGSAMGYTLNSWPAIVVVNVAVMTVAVAISYGRREGRRA